MEGLALYLDTSVRGKPLHPEDLIQRLESRKPKTIDEALHLKNAFEEAHGRFGFVPRHKGDPQVGTYYLESMGVMGVRKYAQHVGGIQMDRDPDSAITHIKLLQETFDENLIRCIINSLEPGRIHIISSACEHLCLGRSASGDINTDYVLDGFSGFACLHNALIEICDLSTVVLCQGATRGGGMRFPSVAAIVFATPDATFGFPEIRRGVLPGVVSVHAGVA